MRKAKLFTAIFLSGMILLQFFRPEKPVYKPVNELAGLPADVNALIRNSCFDCHSTQTNLSWYDKLTPVNYMVYDHIIRGRAALDFSKWDSLTPLARNNILYYSLNKILEKEMPLPAYTSIHPGTRLSEKDVEVLKRFLLNPVSHTPNDSARHPTGNHIPSALTENIRIKSQSPVLPAPNGIDYIADYRNWKVISISDRFDNGTIRIIYGNDQAVKAIQEHKINPYPDGAVLAKVAWKQHVNPDGSITTGDFYQVEFMIKDARKYAATNGWGWARWRGADLKPYGGEATFTTECTSCHRPMKDNDYVFTRPLYLKDYSNKYQ